MNIEDIKISFIALLRDTYDAKQYKNKDYLQSLVEAWPDSDTDLTIGKKVLSALGFKGEVFREVICPALERDGILESYHKYAVEEEEDMEDFPYQFIVNKKKLFAGSGRESAHVSNVSYNIEDQILLVNDAQIPIKGAAQHAILSIVFREFSEEILGQGVFFDEIAEKYDSYEDSKKGATRVVNSLYQVNALMKGHNFHNIFDLRGKKVKLDHN